MSGSTLGAAIAIMRVLPGTSTAEATAAADRAEAAADSVESATVAETMEYLGIE